MVAPDRFDISRFIELNVGLIIQHDLITIIPNNRSESTHKFCRKKNETRCAPSLIHPFFGISF